jgi:Family of unknown function (DUF6928)
VGAKDWMVLYPDGEIASVLRLAPRLDRDATRALVARLYPGRHVIEIADGNLACNANPPDGHLYAGCFPGLTIVCVADVALDQPSKLDDRFLTEAQGRAVYLHAMHSVVDWFAYAIWDGDGRLRHSLSLSPDSGIVENIGPPLEFESAYWAGEKPVQDDEDEEDTYPLPFHPLEMSEDALRALFGFNYEGYYFDDDPDLEAVALAGFELGR